MPGRPRKPTNLHVLHGTGRPARMAERVGEVDCSAYPVGACPSYIGKAGKAEWLRLSEHPVYSKLLTAIDRAALEHYCILYDRMVIDAKGERTMTASERQCFHSLAMQMGMTPASRSKVSMPAAEKKANPWDALSTTG